MIDEDEIQVSEFEIQHKIILSNYLIHIQWSFESQI